jgi:hypothetical protein
MRGRIVDISKEKGLRPIFALSSTIKETRGGGMWIEAVPIVFGIFAILIGGAIAADAWGTPDRGPMRERRRRIRISIDRQGEGLAGTGTLLIGTAMVAGDAWQLGAPVMLLGAVLVIWGGIRSRSYIREILLFRGAARRASEQPIEKPLRIR